MAGNAYLDATLEDITNALEDELMVIDSDYRIRFANPILSRRLSKETISPIGELCYEVSQGREKPCSSPLWDCPLRRVIESGSLTTFIHPIHTLGTETYFKITAYPLRDRQGNNAAIIEVRRDVTAERQLETQILRRHHQLQALSHISSAVSSLGDMDTVLRIGLDNVLELINGTVGGILLLDEKTGKLYYRVQRGLSTRYTEGVRISVGEGLAGKVAQTGEAILIKDISKEAPAANPDLLSTEGLKGFISIPLKVKDKVAGVMNIASHVAGRFGPDDVSLLSSIGDYLGTTIEQERLYERLARVGERNRMLLRYALTAQEDERKRIARELHDETSQALTSVTLSLQAIIGMAEIKDINDSEFMDKLRNTQAYAVRAGSDLVRLMKELRPTLLDELGMAAAINRYARNTLESHNINVSTKFEGTDQRFAPEIEVTLFRIAQGAIGNILEHAEAKNVSIDLKCDAKECILEIKDDGKGFDVSKLTRVEPGGRGAGLFIMRERTSMLGGMGNVESSPGKGTRIIAKVPISTDIYDEEDKGFNS